MEKTYIIEEIIISNGEVHYDVRNFGGAVCRIESGGRCCIWYMSMAVIFTEIRCVLTFR